MILLVRVAVALGVGIVASWIVYAVAYDSISGNGYAYIAVGIGIAAFFVVGATGWYQRFRQATWERRTRRMGGR